MVTQESPKLWPTEDKIQAIMEDLDLNRPRAIAKLFDTGDLTSQEYVEAITTMVPAHAG